MRGLCASLLALVGLSSAASIDVEAARSDAAAALVYASLAREAPVPAPSPRPETLYPQRKPAAGEEVFHPFTPKVTNSVRVAPSCSGGQCREPVRFRIFRRRR